MERTNKTEQVTKCRLKWYHSDGSHLFYNEVKEDVKRRLRLREKQAHCVNCRRAKWADERCVFFDEGDQFGEEKKGEGFNHTNNLLGKTDNSKNPPLFSKPSLGGAM